MGLLLDELPAKQRDAIRCVKIEGLSIAEAAAQTGQSESSVKVGIHRGLKELEKAGWLIGRDPANPFKGKQTWIKGSNAKVFAVLPTDRAESRLDRLGRLGNCSATENTPNQNLTSLVRPVRNGSGDTDNEPSLTSLTSGIETWLGDKSVINQQSNQPNQSNQQKALTSKGVDISGDDCEVF